MIYLIKEDWNNLILSKLSKNESFNEQFLELKKMHQAFRFFINKMNELLKEKTKTEYQSHLNNLLLASMIIFHKYRICSNFSLKKYSSEELYIIIGACVFIGQKAINTLLLMAKEFSEIIQKKLMKKESNKIEEDKIKENLKNKEIEILISIGFNIDIDSPVSFFNKVKNYISKNYLKLNTDNIFKLLKYFIEDSLILPLSLYYTPNTITISCILSLKKKYNLQHINIKELISLSDYYLDYGEIQECTSLIDKLEEVNKEFNREQKNKTKASSNIQTNTNTMNSDKASVTKVIPSIKMNID